MKDEGEYLGYAAVDEVVPLVPDQGVPLGHQLRGPQGCPVLLARLPNRPGVKRYSQARTFGV